MTNFEYSYSGIEFNRSESSPRIALWGKFNSMCYHFAMPTPSGCSSDCSCICSEPFSLCTSLAGIAAIISRSSSSQNYYGASHLTTTTCVQPNKSLKRKVKFAQKTYSFCRNAPLDERNISYWPIFLKLKIEGEKFSHNPQIGGLPYMVYV